MAQTVNTANKGKLTPNPTGKQPARQNNKTPLFRKMNYILMVIGAIILVIGYFCISGGAAEQPDQFNPEVFNTQRTVVAPILLLLGLIVEIFAIMWHPKQKEVKNEESAE